MRRQLFGLVLAAALGGGASIAVLLASGYAGRTTTTVVEQAPLVREASTQTHDAGMTARQIYRRDAPGVVYVRAQRVDDGTSPFDVVPSTRSGVSTGSGFVLDGEGHILTADHVVSGATDIRVTFSGDRTVQAFVVGMDPDTDLAVLAVPVGAVGLHPLELGESASVRVGDPTIAIANPFGVDCTLATGVVSALQRRIASPTGFAVDHVIQTDAAATPGSAGGPLLDAAGRVIGINSQIAAAAASGGSAGVAFALPIDAAKAVLPALLADGRVRRPYLGVQGRDVAGGVLLAAVGAGTPAAAVGLRGTAADAAPADADVLLALDARRVRSLDDLAAALAEHAPGDVVTLAVQRDGRRQSMRVRLAERPAQAPLW